MTRVFLDFKDIKNRKDAHEYLKEAFGFPEYYGANLDALHDCLQEIPPCRIAISNLGLGAYGEKILQVFRDLACERAGFLITISHTSGKR